MTGMPGLHQMAHDFGLPANPFDFNRVGTRPEELRGTVEGMRISFSRSQKRHVSDDKSLRRPANDRPGVHRHQFDRRSQRIALAMHHHHGAVADEQAIDRSRRQQPRRPSIVGCHHDDFPAVNLGSGEVADGFHSTEGWLRNQTGAPGASLSFRG